MPTSATVWRDRAITLRRPALAVLSGLIYAMAYPQWGLRWLVVPGIMGLLVALNGQRGSQARAIGLCHGLAAYGLGLSWMAGIFGVVVILLWMVLAAFTALFAAFHCEARRHGLAGWRLALFAAINWGAWEFIRAEWSPLDFPWMTPGLAIGPNPLLPWIGVYGVSLLVVLVAALLVERQWKVGALTVILLVWLTLPDRKVPAPSSQDPQAVKIVGIQMETASLKDLIAATRELPDSIQYVVWPEYALPYDLEADPQDNPRVLAMARDRQLTMTVGTQRTAAGSWENIALTLDPSGVLGAHVKMHPVHLFDDGLAGRHALPISTRFGRVGTPVCFDCDFEGVVRRMTAAGAEFFAVPSMDAAHWGVRQHLQHAELFRIRACENRRWIIVTASSGVSQIIDPSGQVQASLPALTQGTLTGIVRRESQLTFYTRFGWLIPRAVVAIATIAWGLIVWRSLRMRRRIHPRLSHQ